MEVYHQRFCVNRLIGFIGAGVLIGALKLNNTYTNNFKVKANETFSGGFTDFITIL